jgi:hypothetical protein
MAGKRSDGLPKFLEWIMLFVPAGVLAIDIIFPLRPWAQQALVGITLVWFDMELLLGFPFLKWK